MNNTLTKKEREHVGRVKELACSVCDAPGRVKRIILSNIFRDYASRFAQTATEAGIMESMGK